MSDSEPHSAVGAYVLHALPEPERRAFEEHLATCDSCAREVAELSATVTRLGRAVAVEPPADVKRRVLEEIATAGQEPRLAPDAGAPGRPRRLSRLVLAACVAAAVALGGVAVWQQQEAERARSALEETQEWYAGIAEVMAAPDVAFRTQRLADGGTGTLAVSRSENAAAFIAYELPPLPAGKTYELWFDDDGTFRPAGLLGGAAERQLRVLDGPVGNATAVGITIEPAGGSPHPTTPPLGMFALPA
ncbi:anti-sigma factor domain-containing protein [Streptomyces sp. NPDC059909]|uniref:anti-sigma factor n=1 Tax=Streptomyces sp. NPDC059909 TaxID=3346998 RepID=UPI0036545834